MPSYALAAVGQAEVRLRQRTDPANALDAAQRALELLRKSFLQRKAYPSKFGIIDGTIAWAHAEIGHGADAREAIDTGLRETDTKHKPDLAGFYWRAGKAMLA